MLNICLIGCGGIGTIASLVLEKSKRAKVTAVLRSNYDLVLEKGLDIDSIDHGKLFVWKPSAIVRSVEDAVKGGPYDYAVVCIKALPDVYSVPEIISPVITQGVTSIVLVQNGIDIELPLIKAFPECTVMSVVSHTGTRIAGNFVYHEDREKLFIGAHFHSGIPRQRQIDSTKLYVETYLAGGPTACVYAEDIIFYRWRKLFWNGAFNTLCTLTGLDVGSLQKGGGTETLLRPALLEIYEVTKAAGYTFPENMVEKTISDTPPTSPFKPSMQVDLEKGNPLEIEPILGGLLRHAKELGVATPILSTAYSVLKLVQWKLIQARKST
ncbi:hypothetical protein IFR05_000189 [Cadophora sp. M221]|nr:hypothetical protein IFR05_000189 [Cadophora sp. M221]